MGNAGFSLLELLVTLCLVAILASLSMASWHEIKQQNQLVQTTRQLAYFIHQVQIIAHTHNSNYHLYQFQSPWCLLAVQGDKPSKCEGELRFSPVPSSLVIDWLTDKKVVSFWGRRNMAQTAQLRLQNSAGISKIIISFRGRVRVCAQGGKLADMPKC